MVSFIESLHQDEEVNIYILDVYKGSFFTTIPFKCKIIVAFLQMKKLRPRAIKRHVLKVIHPGPSDCREQRCPLQAHNILESLVTEGGLLFKECIHERAFVWSNRADTIHCKKYKEPESCEPTGKL